MPSTYAELLATAVNQDGKTANLNAPNPAAQVCQSDQASAVCAINQSRLIDLLNHKNGLAGVSAA